jgi:anaerobic magnesium-protoporphyrin IX monomethyl ester cyclase
LRILYLPNSYSQQRQHEKKANIYPVRMAMEAEWYRKQGHQVVWMTERKDWELDVIRKVEGLVRGYKIIQEPENLPFLTLPRPDRVFTRAKEYTSGNYKYLPGTHILSASGCWWGKCSFCVESNNWVTTDFLTGPIVEPNYQVRPVEDVISEIEECKSLGFKEVFDDSATFPGGDWNSNFCNCVRSIGIHLGCNARVGGVYDYKLMFNAGFRMVLFGIESANQETLDKINKGVKVEDIIPTIKRASEAGLEPHIAVMFGYPWETDTEALNTLGLVHYLLRKGYAKTAQASFYCPQEGTQAYQEGQKGQESHRHYVSKIYNAAYYPDFWWNQLRDIANVQDLKYLWRKIKSGINRNRG